MEIKNIEKYLDLVISKCDDPFEFSVINTLIENNLVEDINDNSERWELARSIIKLGVSKNYLTVKSETLDNTYVSLTNKGIEANKVGGYFEYIKIENRKPSIWNSYNTAMLIVTIILGYFTISTNFELRDAKRDAELFRLQVDSLNNVVIGLKAKPIDTIKPRIEGNTDLKKP